STPIVILGFIVIGSATGISQLIRTAAGDMYPPERRARGISYVLVGSVFGAVLGPTVYQPLFADKEVAASSLTVPWLVARGICVLVLVCGALVDRVGRTASLVAGLTTVAGSTLALSWFSGVPMTAVLLFGLGLGWNVAYVSAAAQMADRTRAVERGRLFGFNDLIGALLGAVFALVG